MKNKNECDFEHRCIDAECPNYGKIQPCISVVKVKKILKEHLNDSVADRLMSAIRREVGKK